MADIETDPEPQLLARMETSEIAAVLELDTLDAFRTLRSEQRLRLAEALAEPQTARQAAAVLGVPVTRVYHHLNVLLEHGVIRVVEERPKRGVSEREFQLAARLIVPSPSFVHRYGDEGIREVGALAFRHAEARFLNAVSSPSAKAGAFQPTVVLSQLRLTDARLEEFASKDDWDLAVVDLVGTTVRDDGLVLDAVRHTMSVMTPDCAWMSGLSSDCAVGPNEPSSKSSFRGRSTRHWKPSTAPLANSSPPVGSRRSPAPRPPSTS